MKYVKCVFGWYELTYDSMGDCVNIEFVANGDVNRVDMSGETIEDKEILEKIEAKEKFVDLNPGMEDA